MYFNDMTMMSSEISSESSEINDHFWLNKNLTHGILCTLIEQVLGITPISLVVNENNLDQTGLMDLI